MPSKRRLDRRPWWPLVEPRSRETGSSSSTDGRQSSPTPGPSLQHRPAFFAPIGLPAILAIIVGNILINYDPLIKYPSSICYERTIWSVLQSMLVRLTPKSTRFGGGLSVA